MLPIINRRKLFGSLMSAEAYGLYNDLPVPNQTSLRRPPLPWMPANVPPLFGRMGGDMPAPLQDVRPRLTAAYPVSEALFDLDQSNWRRTFEPGAKPS